MAYVITGATGHVGNNLVRSLLKDNEKVRVIVRHKDRSIDNLPVEYAIGDVFDKDFLAANIHSEDIVIHTAGFIDLKNTHYEECMRVNYDYTRFVTDICLKKKVKKYIYFSSVDCIDKSEKDNVITEPESIHPEHHKSNYAHSKALATNYLLKLMKVNPQLDISIIYPSAIIGINDFKPSAVGKVLLHTLKGRSQFGINGGYNFIDVSDLTRATINLARSEKHGSYLLAGNKVTIIELYNYCNNCLSRRKLTYHVPMIFVSFCVPFIPYLSREVFKIINGNYNYDNSKAVKDIGLEITPFSTTIENTLTWLKNNY